MILFYCSVLLYRLFCLFVYLSDDLEETMVEDCSEELPCSLNIEDSMDQTNSPEQV